MDSHADVGEILRLGLAGWEHANIVWQRQLARDLAGRVVIAPDEVDLDSSLAQACHLPREEQPSVIILPIAIIHIARDEDKLHFLADAELHEVFKSPARGTAQLIHRSAFVAFQPCLLYTSPSPRDRTRSRMPSSAGKKKK